MDYYKFNSTIYQDEAIIVKRDENDEKMPSIIRKMRVLEKNLNIYDQPSEKLFYLQGKILENYEDDFIYNENVSYYFPTYQKLKNEELRGYFTWRTKVRKGVIYKTSLSYAFLYIYELINQIGVSDPLDGYNKLLSFKEEYEKFDNTIIKYLNRWLTDYVIYYNLDNSLLVNSREKRYDNNLLVLLNINEKKNEEILDCLNELSSYKISNSPFYKKNPKECEIILINSLKKIIEYYNNHHKYDFVHDYFNYAMERPVLMFMNCVFYVNNENYREYNFDKIRYYESGSRYWTCRGYSLFNYPSTKLGSLIKSIDSLMREKYNFKKTIKKDVNFKWLDKIVNDEIDKVIKKQVKIIEIDYSKLSNIRKDYDFVKEKLIIADEIEEEVVNVKEEIKPIMNNETVLSDDEYQFLSCLLYHKDYHWVNSKGLMISVLVDSINEKLFDLFSDNVLINDDNLEIIEDYIDELKGMIK